MRKLPMTVTVELLKHMSESDELPKALGKFPTLESDEVKETFGWLAKRLEEQLDEDSVVSRREIARVSKSRWISPTTRKILEELPADEGQRLLRSFGLISE